MVWDSPVDFWNKVKMRLAELNVRQQWLADQTGIGLQTIRNKICNKKFPSFPDVLKIVNALGMSMDEFLEYPVQKKNTVEDLSYIIPVYQDINVAARMLGYKVKEDVLDKESV